MSTDKSPHPNSHRALLKSTSIISCGTLFSRILGFVRDVILAHLFGTAARADAFFVAFRIPNLLRDLMGEGATNAAVVPVFAEYVNKKNKAEMWHFVNCVFSLFLIVLSAVTVLGIFFAPLVVRLIAPGFVQEPEKLSLTVQLTRIMFPYLILIGLTAFSMGILYTLRSFFWPAFSPSLLNVATIASALISVHFMKEPIFGLAIGVLVGGIFQLAVQLVAMKKLGWPIQLTSCFNHPGAKKIGRLILPRLFGSGVYQLNVFIDTLCASLSSIVGMGGISAIYYATRLVQFPQGIFGVALASALLPTLSRLVVQEDSAAFKKTILFSLRNILLVMFPMTMILGCLADPIVRILFERGEFDAYSTEITSRALMFYAPALLSYGCMRVLVTAFHSMQDTSTPVKMAGIGLLVNAVLNFTLMVPLKVGGIALSSTIAVSVNMYLLLSVLDKKIGGLKEGMLHYFIRCLLASAVMGVVLVGGFQFLPISNAIIRLAVVLVLGLAVFLAMCLVLKIEETKIFLLEMKRLLFKS